MERVSAPLRYDYTQRDPLASVADDNWLKPSPDFNRSRVYLTAGTGAVVYTGFGIALYAAWYKGYDREPFHTFDDSGEWLQMDKGGHFFTAYMMSRYSFAGARWAGLRRPASRLVAFGVANLLQGTIETLDGFSSNWGFSWTDMAANVSGSLAFTAQDLLWQEQRILIKVSSDLRAHPDVPVRAVEGEEVSNLGYASRLRYGDYPFERYLKDYNALTVWASANPASFFPRSRLPQWLNLAVGYSVEDVYGAYANGWEIDGTRFSYDGVRYRQWFLSPDVYFSRIPTRKRWVRLTLGILDFVKFPAPVLEYSRGRLRGHWLQW